MPRGPGLPKQQRIATAIINDRSDLSALIGRLSIPFRKVLPEYLEDLDLIPVTGATYAVSVNHFGRVFRVPYQRAKAWLRTMRIRVITYPNRREYFHLWQFEIRMIQKAYPSMTEAEAMDTLTKLGPLYNQMIPPEAQSRLLQWAATLLHGSDEDLSRPRSESPSVTSSSRKRGRPRSTPAPTPSPTTSITTNSEPSSVTEDGPQPPR